MKYFAWVCVFVGYVLACAGIFIIIGNMTRGVTVERTIMQELTIRGETTYVEREVELEFNELPEVVMTLGMLGLFITIGTAYFSSNIIVHTWNNEDLEKRTKLERLLRLGTFFVFFLIFSFIFGVHQVTDIFSNSGYLFMAATCGASIVVSEVLPKYLLKKKENAEQAGNEGVVV